MKNTPLSSEQMLPDPQLQALRALVADMRPPPAEEQPLAPLVASQGKVIIYDHRGLGRFSVLPAEHQGRDNNRRKAVIDRLVERGPERSLGAWPTEAMLEAFEALKRSHPNFVEITDHVISEAVFAMEQGRAICSMRLLIDGPAGIGKTDYAMVLGRALELPLRVCSMSASNSSFEISGLDEGYSGSRPGMVFDEVTEGPFANPAFLLDEIDKVPERHREVVGALYQLFETHSARNFRDKSVPFLEFDASHINWLVTANEVDAIEPALLSRFHRFEIQRPTRAQYPGLIQRLYQQMAQELGFTERFPVELNVEDVERLAAFSPREIKRALRTAFLNAVRGKTASLIIDSCILSKISNCAESHPIGFIWSADEGERHDS